MKIFFIVPDYYEGRPKPCMDGWGKVFLTVTPDGVALPCHAARDLPELEFPNIADHNLKWIWYDSPAFNTFRGTDWMKEPCASCDEREKDYGGCRCQSFRLTGDAHNADPTCSKSPHHFVIQKAILQSESTVSRQVVFRNRKNSIK
jgi:pyrroloquinoline quinone biosynthesis protein E